MTTEEWAEDIIRGEELQDEARIKKAIISGWKYLEKNGDRVYSENGVSYTSDSIIKALKIAVKEATKL